MIREALQFLSDLRAAALEPIKLLDRPERKLFLFRDGQKVDVLVPAEPRSHQVNTIGDFATAAKRWLTDRSVVFHSHFAVWFCADDSDRREMVVLPLQQTDVFAQVTQLGEKVFDQRSFLRLLRHDLAGVIPATLVSAIQRIEVVTSGNLRSEVTPGRERGTREFRRNWQPAARSRSVSRVRCRSTVCLALITRSRSYFRWITPCHLVPSRFVFVRCRIKSKWLSTGCKANCIGC